jgi:hypothetical protein
MSLMNSAPGPSDPGPETTLCTTWGSLISMLSTAERGKPVSLRRGKRGPEARGHQRLKSHRHVTWVAREGLDRSAAT